VVKKFKEIGETGNQPGQEGNEVSKQNNWSKTRVRS
jgi:hypothetical protein